MGEGSGETLEAKQEPFKADRCFQGRKSLGSASRSSFLVVVPRWLAQEKRQLLQALAGKKRNFCHYRVLDVLLADGARLRLMR